MLGVLLSPKSSARPAVGENLSALRGSDLGPKGKVVFRDAQYNRSQLFGLPKTCDSANNSPDRR